MSPPSPGALPQQVSENIESVVGLHQREHAKLNPWERLLDKLGMLIGRPLFLIGLLAAVSLWIVFNLSARALGWPVVDAPPFEILDLVLTLSALTTTTVVLIAQQRQARLESRKAHLDLQISLLAEQKASKIIRLLEELRRDLPMVRDRHDEEASNLQRPTDTGQVLSALEDVGGNLGIAAGAGPKP